MRRTAVLTLTLALVLAASACATLKPDADAFLTRSEQALAVSVDTLDALFILEKANRTEMEALVPGCHATAETVRRKAPDAIRAAIAALDAYRAAKGTGGDTAKAQVEVCIASLQALVAEVKPLLARWSEAKAGKGGGK